MHQVSPKVVSSSVGSAAAIVLIYFAQLAGFEMSEPVAAAIVVLVVFGCGYFTRDPLRRTKR